MNVNFDDTELVNLCGKIFQRNAMVNFADENEFGNVFRKILCEMFAKLNKGRETGDPKFIKGINGLAEYLGVSKSKAQKLKNGNVIPYVQDGRLILFDPRKVDEALKRKSPHYN